MASAHSPYMSRNSTPSSRRWGKSGRVTPPPFSLASPAMNGLQVVAERTAGAPQAVIIYWEDVLAPTRWMAKHLGLGRTAQSIDYAVRAVQASPQLQTALATIEIRVMEVITQAIAVANGLPVCIMADATTAYVELVSSLFFPRLTTALRNAATGIYVVGTPDTDLDARELATWKKNALHTICLERFFSPTKSTEEVLALFKQVGSGRVNVIALCGSTLDLMAAQQIRQVAPYAVLKTAHVGASADIALEGFYDRLRTFAEFMKEAAARSTATTVRV